MKVVQVKLEQDGKELVAWVDHTKKLKAGKRITLKGQPGWWNVKEVYDLVIRESTNIKTDW